MVMHDLIPARDDTRRANTVSSDPVPLNVSLAPLSHDAVVPVKMVLSMNVRAETTDADRNQLRAVLNEMAHHIQETNTT